MIAAACLLVAAGSAVAEPFIYSARDVLLGFRRVNGTKELLVNLGASSNFFNATPGAVIPMTGFFPGQLVNAFTDDLSALRWSVSAAVISADGGDTNIPRTTLWMTRPRTNLTVQTPPWNRASIFSQGGAANKVASMGLDGQNISNLNPPDPIENTRTAVTEPGGNVNSYSTYVSSAGNFGGNFQGNVENLTGQPFTEAVRSDFYEMYPGSGPGRYLGFFELRPDGTLTFQAAGGGGTPFRTRIQSIVREGITNTVSFTTTNDAAVTYRLLFTNHLGLAAGLTNWAGGSVTVPGNGQVRILRDETGDSDRFYSVSEAR
jgi:hypothetical protein